jgi:hypothetical protein
MTRLLRTASKGGSRGGREDNGEIKWLAWKKKGGKRTKLGRSNEPLAFVNNSRAREASVLLLINE